MRRSLIVCVAVLIGSTGVSAAQESFVHPDAVVARVFEHFRDGPRPLVLIARQHNFDVKVWQRVKSLVGFRIHRPTADGGTRPDAAIYLVDTSALYLEAAATMRSGATTREYVWCLLASVIAHEAAHTAPDTERLALTAELQMLRRCLSDGHLHASDGWNPATHIGKVEARLRNPREHK